MYKLIFCLFFLICKDNQNTNNERINKCNTIDQTNNMFNHKIYLEKAQLDKASSLQYLSEIFLSYIYNVNVLISYSDDINDIVKLIYKYFNAQKISTLLFGNDTSQQKLDIIFKNIAWKLILEQREITQNLNFEKVEFIDKFTDDKNQIILKVLQKVKIYSYTTFGFEISWYISYKINKSKNFKQNQMYVMTIYIDDLSTLNDNCFDYIYKQLKKNKNYLNNLESENKNFEIEYNKMKNFKQKLKSKKK